MNHKREKSRRQVRCTLCTPYRWMGNAKGQLDHGTMTLKTTPWDSAEYLETEEDIALYTQAVMEEGGDDPAYITHGLGVIARARNMSQLARDTGITREGPYKALGREPLILPP